MPATQTIDERLKKKKSDILMNQRWIQSKPSPQWMHTSTKIDSAVWLIKSSEIAASNFKIISY